MTELLEYTDRARTLATRRPGLDPKQRMAQAAESLNLAGALQAQIGVAESALVAFIQALYTLDADQRPANYDEVTGRILIPAPWGSSGWRHWGLRKTEAFVLRKVLLSRVGHRTTPPLFGFDNDSKQWFLDTETYPDADSALRWVRDRGPGLNEWRTIVSAHRDAEAERLRVRRSR